jgi:hypothetical protein
MDLGYLADCSENAGQDYILRKLESARSRKRAIDAEWEAMVQELADAEVARRLLEEPEALRAALDGRQDRANKVMKSANPRIARGREEGI